MAGAGELADRFLQHSLLVALPWDMSVMGMLRQLTILCGLKSDSELEECQRRAGVVAISAASRIPPWIARESASPHRHPSSG